MIDIFFGLTLAAVGVILLTFLVFLGAGTFILALFFIAIVIIGWFLLVNIVEVIVILALVALIQLWFLAYYIFKYFKLKSIWDLRGYHFITYIKKNRNISKHFLFRLATIVVIIFAANFVYYKSHTSTQNQLNGVENKLIKEI